MSRRKTQHTDYAPRRRMGCLPRLIILILGLGACYWLVFSPIQPQEGQGETPTASQSQSEQSSTVSGNENGTPEPNTSQNPTPEPVVDGELTAEQQTGLAELSAQSSSPPDVLVEEGVVRFLSLNVSVPDTIAVSAAEKAIYFLKENSEFFQLGNAGQNLRPEGRMEDGLGNTYMRYSQQYKGVPVYGSDIIVGVNEKDEVDFMNGGYVPNLEIDVQPTVRSIEAEQIALEDLDAEDGKLAEKTYLAIYAPEVWGESAEAFPPKLAWFVTAGSESGFQAWLYVMDAKDGSILAQINLIAEFGGSLQLKIYDAERRLSGTPTLVFTENGPVPGTEPHPDAGLAYNNLLRVFNYYLSVFNRTSFDNQGKLIQVITNENMDPCAAYWAGNELQMHICTGWAEGIDVMAHEYTHAVIQHTAQFIFEGQPRELNEAFSDIFAAFIDDKEPWIITQPPDANGNTIRRNIMNPKPKYPRKYSQRYCYVWGSGICLRPCPFGPPEETYEDCGHVNSVVFSHAAFLMAEGNGSTIEGISIEKIQYIYYRTLYKISGTSTQKNAAKVVVESCDDLINATEWETPDGSLINITNLIQPADCLHAQNALAEVGLINSVPPPPPSTSTPSPTPTLSPDSTPSPIVDPPPDPGGQSWWDIIRELIRQWLDQLTDDIRKQIEDWIAQQLKLLEDALKQGLQQFVDQLIQSLLEACFGSVAAPATVPLVLYYYKRKRKKP